MIEREIIQIVTGFNHKEVVPLDQIDPKQLISKLIEAENEVIILSGSFLDQFDSGIEIFVDDDIQSLIVSYLHLEKIVLMNSSYQHGEFLNDGFLSFTAHCDGKNVDIELRYCPRSDIANLVERSLSLSPTEYLWWWRTIAHQIYMIADSFTLKIM